MPNKDVTKISVTPGLASRVDFYNFQDIQVLLDKDV